ncbi:MAG: Gfo/Idh/MocA family oxidoreductase [Bacteroidetes bacterium]|nr:MAG: Gfo/Idh/MocA family oxidoreductase [Bacteroidota bacterium]
MLKVGVFGAGHLGKIHIKLLLELSDRFELVGFFDPSDEQAKIVAESYGIKRFDQEQELLDAVSCVDIVTPTVTHFELASRAIQSGKHVFIEKPVANSVEEAEELIRLAEKHGVIVQVGHVERFNPAFQKAQPFLDRPMFIETHRLAQFNPRGTDVPVVLDLMIHDIDIILSIVRSPVEQISASGVAVVSDSDDITNVRIEFQNGCVANLTSSRISLKNMRKSRFFQKDAYISVDFLSKEIEVVRMENVEGEADPLDIVLDLGEGKAKKRILFDKPEIDESNAIKEELEDFHGAIEEQRDPVVSLRDGVEALRVASLILEKLDQSKLLI